MMADVSRELNEANRAGANLYSRVPKARCWMWTMAHTLRHLQQLRGWPQLLQVLVGPHVALHPRHHQGLLHAWAAVPSLPSWIGRFLAPWLSHEHGRCREGRDNRAQPPLRLV